MRYLLSVFGVLAALVFVCASGVMNWIFWSGQGRTGLEGDILGAVSGAVDVFKCLLPILVARSWANRKWIFVGIGSTVFVLFLAFSLLSAIGFAAGNRGFVSGGREALGLRLDQANADLEATREKRKEMPSHRPVHVVEEAIKGDQLDGLYTWSKSCTEANWKNARDFCKGYFDLKAELASAVEDDRLAAKTEALALEIRRLREQGAGQDKDPQARMLAMLSGLELDKAQKVLIVFVAILVELGAAFGLYLATGWGAEHRPTSAPASLRVPVSVAMATHGETLPAQDAELLVETEALPRPTRAETTEPGRGPRKPRKAIEPPKPFADGREAFDGGRRLIQAEDGTWVIVYE